MSEYTVVPVTYEAEISRNLFLDMWRFNNFQAPEFWFGEKVKFHHLQGIILGLEWRPQQPAQRSGWWYSVQWDGRQSTQRVHQDSLTADRESYK